MLILIFGGLIVAAELCALSWHEARRNQNPRNALQLQDDRSGQAQREAADSTLTTTFPAPKRVESNDVLESLALLKNREAAERWADLGDRLM